MATQVFISWGGDPSQQLAKAINEWLPAVLQTVIPYFTPDDIGKGAKWDSEISTKLEETNIGLICLTRNNTEKPWILFEAGALSKYVGKSNVCPILFDLEPTDVQGPLATFQHTKFKKEEFKRLITTINNATGDAKLSPTVLDNTFNMWWPKLEDQVNKILASQDDSDDEEKRSDRDLLEEVLALTRMNSSRIAQSRRYNPRKVMELIKHLDQFCMEVGSISDLQHAEVFSLLEEADDSLRSLCTSQELESLFEGYIRTRTILALETSRKLAPLKRPPAADDIPF